MANNRKRTFKKMKKDKKINNREEVSQEQNFQRALKKIEVQDGYIND